MNNLLYSLEVAYSSEMQSFVSQVDLNPWWIAGIVAGEGSFIISHSDSNFTVRFSIALTTTNQHLIWAIWEYFGRIGRVSLGSNDCAQLVISNPRDIINVLIPFFDQYSVLGNKSLDYAGFREVTHLIHSKLHLTESGYQRCLHLYSVQNTGRDFSNPANFSMIINSFPDYSFSHSSPFPKSLRPLGEKLLPILPNIPIAYTPAMANLVSQVTLNPWWIAGFVAGEGCFMVGISASKTFSTGFHVKPNFQIALTRSNQHLLWAIWEYFDRKGGVNVGGSTMARFQMGGIKDLNSTIIPFFDQYSVLGNKCLDYADFRKALGLMGSKTHLTPAGLAKCRIISNRINTGRDCSLPVNRAMIRSFKSP